MTLENTRSKLVDLAEQRRDRIACLEAAILDAVDLMEHGLNEHAAERLRATVTCGPRPIPWPPPLVT